MAVCLFAPTVIFTMVGYKSLKILSNRPTHSREIMIRLITKLVIATTILMSILGLLMKYCASH